MSTGPGKILTINSGSSSIKFSVYDMSSGGEVLLLSGKLDRIGLEGGGFSAYGPRGEALAEGPASLPGHGSALKLLFKRLDTWDEGRGIRAVGHRVVHGGREFATPRRINRPLLEGLKRLLPFATEHLPHEIKAIEAVTESFPGMAQFACFDTSFHRGMPEASRTFPLPLELRDEGVERYGFHGLSYEYIVSVMKREREDAGGRMIVAHLGNGASMAAVKNGVAMDTTMGFTPTGGLMMSTRTGDLDPGVVVYLARRKGLDADGINELVSKKSGLLGVSGISPAMEDLLASESPRAALAVLLFCHTARKHIGALCATLGGLDTLVFTGGMGENSPEIREKICAGLEFLGVEMDPALNAGNEAVISREGAPAQVRVVKTNEELVIARHTAGLVNGM